MAASFDPLAFGTMGPAGADPASAAASVYDCTKHALATGFRHLDTAELYEATVPHVARAIADSGIARQSLFITSKLRGLPLGSEEQVAARVAHHIAQLGGNVGYLDLLLIHWPGKADIDPSANPDAQDISGACDFSWFSDNIGAAWANMLALRRSGLVRHIGVSNFYEPHLRALLHHIDAADASQRPFANQIFLDVAHQQLDFVSYMQALDIRVIAYRPLAFLSTLSMLDDMGDTSASDAIAAASALFSAAALPLPTTHQLVLGALLARGIAVTTSSSNIEHIEATHQVKALVSTHHDLLSNVATLLQAIDNNETIEMCGAFDEFARACADAAATTAEACQ